MAAEVQDRVWSRIARHDVASFRLERSTESPRIVDQAAVLPMQERFGLRRADDRLRISRERIIDRALAEESFISDPFDSEEAQMMWSL